MLPSDKGSICDLKLPQISEEAGGCGQHKTSSLSVGRKSLYLHPVCVGSLWGHNPMQELLGSQQDVFFKSDLLMGPKQLQLKSTKKKQSFFLLHYIHCFHRVC